MYELSPRVDDIVNLKKDQIIAYLRSRKQKISGNKHDIATTALNFLQIELGISDSLSLSENNSVPPSSDNLPIYDELSTGWSSDPALLPELALSDIEKYLIHSSHRTSDSMKMECYRQYIRGLNFYKENYAHKVMINTLSESSKWHAADFDDTACTSKPWKWNKPSKRKNDAKTVENITFKKIKINDAEPKYEPNNNTCKQFNDDKLSLFRSKHANRLGNKSDAVLFDLISPTLNDVPFESDLRIAEEISASDFLETPSVCGGDVVEEIEMRTRGQHENPLWEKSQHNHKLVKTNWSKSNEIDCSNIPALKWGRKMEVVAYMQFKALNKLKHKQTVNIVEQGLYLHQQNPDGLVLQNDDKYLVAVKCPYKWRYKTFTEACKDSEFCFAIDEQGAIALKPNHIYHTQIQGQMRIYWIQKSELLVYTTKD
ncbi:hypothetical protein MAR_032511 [Mya arenaria]|uniref:YqaJ viral recombinase domain-containing protein n=1 Tax=Mya arenaria TaxID=6604 RepID=A0ABY7F6U9_MYAAR|nr:hypothetical protein MAR_032511 [Mya arenaria]